MKRMIEQILLAGFFLLAITNHPVLAQSTSTYGNTDWGFYWDDETASTNYQGNGSYTGNTKPSPYGNGYGPGDANYIPPVNSWDSSAEWNQNSWNVDQWFSDENYFENQYNQTTGQNTYTNTQTWTDPWNNSVNPSYQTTDPNSSTWQNTWNGIESPSYQPTPDVAKIAGFTGEAQQYNLDCETQSAIDFAAYFGVIIDHDTFLNALPHSDDPNEGFVGNYTDSRGQLPPASYGVYQEPVAELLRNFGLSVSGVNGYTFEEIRQQIAAGNPVMVWVAGNTELGNAVPYTPSNGRTTTVVPYQHTVVVTGYDGTYVTIQDGADRYIRTIDVFKASWETLGNRAIVYNG